MDSLLFRSFYLLTFLLLIHHSVSPPTKEKNKEPGESNASNEDKPINLDELGIEYKRYLKEVVDALESDPEFRKKLETASEADFRNGKVAAELEYVNHHVRTKLDELKRTELQRLRDLVRQAEELEKNEVDPNHVNPGHVDHSNPHTFESADLHKLITQVRKDLAEADRKRREEFKEYELQKKFEAQQKIVAMDEEKRKQFLMELEEQKKKHAKHEPLHHPGSKAQLEEVWQKEDHMEDQKFNPRTFFLLHDINSDGYWDEDEVKALFIKELDKLYQAGVPEDDMREREEEMERMREHVFKESDTNGDRLISYQEFLEQTKRKEFNRDEGWETIDSQPQFTQQEYEEFERRRLQEIQHLIDQGLLQPYAPGMMPPPPVDHQGQYQQYHPEIHGAQQYAQNMPYPPKGSIPQYAPGHGQYAPAYVNQPLPNSNQVPPHSAQVPSHSAQVPPHSAQVPPHYAQVPPHSAQVPPHSAQVAPHSAQAPPHPAQVPQQQYQVYQQPHQFQGHPANSPESNAIPQQNQPALKTPDQGVDAAKKDGPGPQNYNSVPSNVGKMPANNQIPQSYGKPQDHPSDANIGAHQQAPPQVNQIPQAQYDTHQGAYYQQQQPHHQQGIVQNHPSNNDKISH